MFKKIILFLFIILVSGISGIFADRYFFPYFSATEFFNKSRFLKKLTQDVTVINKTEQVFVKEETSITKISNQTSSSVVNIISYNDSETKVPSSKAPVNIPFKNGTGLIATSDGIIMTYLTAVIPENAKYKVMIFDGNVYDAELLVVDSYSNLVFLKISASNLPSVSFANSSDFKAGEKIIALGNSLKTYQNIYTSGIINAYDPFYNLSGKTISSSEKLEGVFRADLIHEEIFVGGPIIDFSGQVVGITGSVEKDGKTEFFQIPASKARLVLDKAIKKELSDNYYLGLYYIPITRSYALANNLKTDKGAMVYSPSGQQGLAVLNGSPANLAGIKIFDIITKINGEEISPENSFSDILATYKKGQEIGVTVLRDGAEINMTIKM